MTDADGNEEFEELTDDESSLSELGEAANALRDILKRETTLANAGGLNALSSAIRAKRDAWDHFRRVSEKTQASEIMPGAADQEALQDLVAAANENALILEAVKSTISDFADRLRVALTEAADPGIYGPRGKGPRHAMAARLDRRI